MEKLRGIFIYFARRCGPGDTRPIRKPGGPPAEEEEESVEIGRKRRGNWRREEKMLPSLLNYWTVHSGSFAYSNIYTDSILPPVLLSPSGLPRQVGRGRGGCAREDVSSRGSRGVNYFTILFEEARAWNLRNEIPRRLAETWLIFYRRPVYIYIGIRSLLRKFHLTFPPNRSRTSISTLAIF